MSKPQAVVCLAAGPSQKLLIEKAKAAGFFVIGVDKNPDAPGFAWCDAEILLSTYDAAPIIEALKSFQASHHIVGVLNSSSGPPVATAARLSEWLGLPGVKPEIAETLTHKVMLMEACRKKKIRVPQGYSEQGMHHVGYPCVVKPSLSLSGKGGVALVQDASAFLSAVENAKSFSMDGLIEIEAYIPGEDVTLFAMVDDSGALSPVVLFDEVNRFRDDGSVSAHELVMPSRFWGTPIEAKIIALATQVVEAFDLKRTPLLFSCRVSQKGEPYLIEVHLNMGGDQIFERLFPAVCIDFDVMTWAIYAMCGESQPLPSLAFEKCSLVFQDNRHMVPGPGSLLTCEVKPVI